MQTTQLLPRPCLQASPHLESLALCTEASNVCCHMVAAGGGTAALLHLLQSAGRDKSCQDALRGALLCLAHLCRHRGRAEEVFHQEGLLMLLAKLLADHRDKEVGRRSCLAQPRPASPGLAWLGPYCAPEAANC